MNAAIDSRVFSDAEIFADFNLQRYCAPRTFRLYSLHRRRARLAERIKRISEGDPPSASWPRPSVAAERREGQGA